MDTNKSPLAKVNGWKKSSGIALAALLVFGAVAGVMAFSPRNALAQTTPTITTSTNKFFGNAFAQVIISDNDKNSDSNLQESVAATVTVKDETGAQKDSQQVTAYETGKNSGQFEFFVTTRPGDSATPNPFAPRSSLDTGSGVTVDSRDKVSIVRFGNAPARDTGAANADLIMNTGTTNPKDGWKVEVEYIGAASIKTINYASTGSQFSIDRGVTGTGDSTIFTITDQDGNDDPTKIDTITASGVSTATTVPLGSANLFTGQFKTGDTFTFTETGTNTGVFENIFTGTQLAIPPTLSAPATAIYVLKDYDVYNAQTGTGSKYPVTPTQSTITKSLVFQNQDGTLTPLTSISAASELPITVTDSDLNASTRTKDVLTSVAGTTGVTVTVDGTAGADSEAVNLKETGDNTGVFAADLNQGQLPVAILNSGTPTANNGVLELRTSDIAGTKDVIVNYYDPNTAHGTTNVLTSTVRLPLSHTPGVMTFDSATATSTGKINAVLNDPDLNNDANAIDSYTVALSGTAPAYDFTGMGNIASIAVKIKGVSTGTTAPATAQTIVFIETGPNTGVFKAEVDVSRLSASFSDGDQVEFKYQDKLETPTAESTGTFTIGKPSTGITVDRTTVGIPLKSGEPAAVVGLTGTPGADSVKFRLTITDASLNTDSGVQETLSVNNPLLSESLTKQAGGSLTVSSSGSPDILFTGFPLTETGPNTGIFSGMITLMRTSSTSLADFDNAKLAFTYDNNVASVTLRPNDLVITTNSTIVRNGDNLLVTITDLDRNLSSEDKDTVPFMIVTRNDALSGTGATFTGNADETDVNTGVFQKIVKIGTDIKLTSVGTSVTQATELKITATDRISVDRTSPDRDLTIKVGTSTGTLSVTPDVVGPGTKMIIITTDQDLNTNPAGVDTIPSSGTNTDFVTVTTDRTGFPTTKVAGEETGANTAMFKTTIKLKPKTTALTTAPATPVGTKDLTGFEVLPGDLISVKYVDTKDANGNKVTISKVVKVVSVDPEMIPGKPEYGVNESITFTIKDVDANTDGEATDSLKVRVTSDSDPVGFDISGLETGVNTGEFTFSVPTTTSVSSGAITVKNGDNVSFKYTDTYPAGFEDRVKQLADPSKDFFLLVPIGAPRGPTSTTPSAPVLKDVSGKILTEVTAGSQVVLSTDITNNNDAPQPFAAIVEVRDADGITIYLQWQTGTLNANGTSGIGLSWTPDMPGTYTVRTFVLSSIANPQVLSPVAESTYTVS